MSAPHVFTVSKADPTRGANPLPGAILEITADLPRVRDTLELAVWRAANISQHEMDARQVVAALASLPQGTVDQVLVLLLQQKASLLRVPGSGFPPPTLQVDPPAEFRAAVAVILDEAARDRPSLPPVTPDSAAEALWFAVRALVPGVQKEEP